MSDRIKAIVSRLSAMRLDETSSVERATITRLNETLWMIERGKRREAFTLNRAALFIHMLEQPPRLVEFAIKIRLFGKLPNDAKSRMSELDWHRREEDAEFASAPLPPAKAEEWRTKLADIGVVERDITEHFDIGVLNTPIDQDGLGIVVIMRLGSDRMIAIRKRAPGATRSQDA